MSAGLYNTGHTISAATISSTAISLLALRAAASPPNRAITAVSLGVETNNVRMGASNVTAANGTLLEAGTKLFLDCTCPDLWFIATGSDATLQATFFYDGAQ